MVERKNLLCKSFLVIGHALHSASALFWFQTHRDSKITFWMKLFTCLTLLFDRKNCHWYTLLKEKRFKKIAWIRSQHLHFQWKFKLLPGKFDWGNKAKHCWVMSTNFLFSNVCWQCSAMFCLYTSSKLSQPYFEFSLKMKVVGSNSGYLLKSFLLYLPL